MVNNSNILPLVSIIVPNYNHDRFLKQRLDSVFNQTYTEFEVLILDDASTDKSVEIIKQYENHPKVSQLIINSENSGSPFMQWKKGIELAKGKYIWIAESDDYNTENFLKESMKYLEKENDVGLVFNKTVLVNEDGEEIEELIPLTSGIYRGAELLNLSFVSGNLIFNGSSVFFRKNLMVDVLDKLQKFQICGDWLLWSTIVSKGKIAFSEASVSYYRKHNEATTDNLFKNPLFYNEAFDIIFQLK